MAKYTARTRRLHRTRLANYQAEIDQLPELKPGQEYYTQAVTRNLARKVVKEASNTTKESFSRSVNWAYRGDTKAWAVAYDCKINFGIRNVI